MPASIILNLLAATGLLFSYTPGDSSIHTPQAIQLKDSEASGVTDKRGMEIIAVDLADDFILPLHPDGNSLGLKTKEDYMNYYKNISDPDLAEEFLNAFFIEENGVMEHIPTEPPLWFDSSLPYEFKQLSDKEMAISQFSSIELYGPTTLTVFYKKRDGNKWIIDDVHYETEREGLNEV
ncbi:hypothetical protein QNH23_13025 [Siminovitchia fortis]|uniref:DUF3828 domain-containing protein n=1 Tax=Siminovitchia fortis TaxID=254758 RepID=A0A443ILW9_9BACI|nr:hypothetical protein [Siminovitchia fortis]RWR06537.1 hypothetical protein D4N35_014155 [Siminovitchia fortis]WHY80835.1 hypothetical protein QNH23_13025 [Siminovitchia fortis]